MTLSREKYTKEFETLMLNCNIQEIEKLKVARYPGGLNSEIFHLVQLREYWFLNDFIHLKVRVEKQFSENIHTSSFSSNTFFINSHKTLTHIHVS